MEIILLILFSKTNIKTLFQLFPHFFTGKLSLIKTKMTMKLGWMGRQGWQRTQIKSKCLGRRISFHLF